MLDLETTGLSSVSDRIIEIGVLLVDARGIEQRFAGTLVNPHMVVPGAATAVNGITTQMAAAAPPFAQLAASLERALAGRVLVGHNIASFDNRFLHAEFSRCGIDWVPGRVIDTLKLARKLLPGIPSRKLAALCALAGITNAQEHRAEGDVRATWELLHVLVASDVDDLLGLKGVGLSVPARTIPKHLVARSA